MAGRGSLFGFLAGGRSPALTRCAEACQTSQAKDEGMKAALALAVMLTVTACGESEDEIYERGYDEGYNDGQYEVCRELESIAPRLKDQLTGCDGF